MEASHWVRSLQIASRLLMVGENGGQLEGVGNRNWLKLAESCTSNVVSKEGYALAYDPL